MRLRRFEAATVTEALARVKADLGPEAVILHASAAGPAHGGGRVEVMAAVDDEPTATRTPSNRIAGGGRRESRRLEADVIRTGSPQGPGLASAPCASPSLGEARHFSHAEYREPDRMPAAFEDIHRLLLELQFGAGSSPRVPAALRPAYRQLLAQEVPAGVARRLLLAHPPGTRSGRDAPDPARLQQLLVRGFRVSGPITPERQPCAVALVGPTGVGKTTTIAKLAGQFRHVEGRSVALVSLDTYRIGAMAQMGIFADLLGVPLHIVRTPADMRAALLAERNTDLLLVDTMGRSPSQGEGIAAIRHLLAEIPDLDVHLVVSATTKGTDLDEILRRFRPLQYRCVLVTKLDEARTVGPLLSLALQRDLVISYLGTGQEVPDDLEAATPRRLAALLVPGNREKQRRTAATSRGNHADRDV